MALFLYLLRKNKNTGEMPLQQAAARLLHAVEVFMSARAKFLICAGKGAGIPKKCVNLDITSRNTREHAEELSKIFQEKNIKIGLVTSAYRMKRSEGKFTKIFSEKCHISNRGENLNKLTDFLMQVFSVTITKVIAHNICYLYVKRY